MKVLKVIGSLIKIGAVIFGIWLSIWVMLAGGAIQAIEGFKIGNTSMGVWGVIRALFFELGTIPAWIIWIIGDVFEDNW